jgi:hypothetical protein
MVSLLGMLLAIAGLMWISQPSIKHVVAISVVSALGMWTMPSFLFVVAGIYLWIAALFVFQHGLKRLWSTLIVPCGILTLLGTVILYVPTIVISKGIHPLTNNSYVTNLPWSEFFRQMPGHLKETYALFVRHVPVPLQWLLLALIALAAGFSIRKKNLKILFLLPALILGSAFVLLLKHAIPYDRTWIFFIPMLLIVADAGFAFLTASLRPQVRVLLTSLLFLWTCTWGIRLINRNAVGRFPDTGAFPEAPVLVRFLAPDLTPNDSVIGQCPADETMSFYLWYYGVPSPGQAPDTSRARRFYVVKKTQYSIEDLTRNRTSRWIEYNNAAVYVEEERKDTAASPH